MVPSTRWVALLLFGSGFAALAYQTAWQRMFRLSFGASTAASAAVLAIFLGGLGLGGALLGKRVERSPRPLAFYGNLELGIALLAALSPVLIDWTHAAYLALGGSQTLGMLGATVVRLLLAALVIGPAAVLMGGTLPAAARAVVSEADESRSRLALLYSLNTVGAVVGALVGPLLLFGLLGNQLTLWGAACLNLLVAIVARALGRDAPPLPAAMPDAVVPEAAASETAASETAADLPPGGAGLAALARAKLRERLAYAVAAAVGFAFLALELVWYRVLTPLLGGSSLTFGLILACALAGIGLGGYLFSRRPESKPATLELLATTLALEAFCVLLPFAWGDDLALLAAHLRGVVNLGFGHLVASWLFVAAVIVFPASVVSGYQFPVLFSLLGRGRAGVGRQVGKAYAFNTIGTLSGSLLAGFVLLPSLGALALWRALALLLAALGVACALLAWRSSGTLRSLTLPLVTALAALALSTNPGPGHLFRHSPVGAGRLEVAELSPNEVIALRRRTEGAIIWERDGVESTVAISANYGISFLVNGKSDGSVVNDRGTQAFLGLLPAALHGRVESAFVVGLGSGMTAGLLARVPGVERVEVAELEPSVVEVARRARLANGDVLSNRKVQLLNGDGRELLLTSKRQYDLIVSEPSNPYRAGVASLFTREFYAAAASRLRRRGLFAQWIQGYEIDARTLSMAIHTLRSVFSHVSLWGPEGLDLILIGSFQPQTIDAERLRRELSSPAYLEWMRRAWSSEGVEALVAHHLAGPAAVDALARRLPSSINTDDVNLLEVAFGRRVGDGAYTATRDLFRTLEPAELRPSVAGAIDWTLVDDQRQRVGWSAYQGPAASTKTDAVLAGCGGSMQRAGSLWPEDAQPSDLIEAWVLGYVKAVRGDESALQHADRLHGEGFTAEALLVRERLAEAHKDREAAVTHLLGALEQLRMKALPLCDAADRALKRATALALRLPARAPELLRALAKGPFAVHQADLDRRLAQALIGGRLDDPKWCVEGLGSFRQQPVWELEPLALRALCLKRASAPDADAAAADLAEFISNEPETFEQAQSQPEPEPELADTPSDD